MARLQLFDAGRRTGALGSSPSIQVLETTLTAGAAGGAALQNKGDGEFALAVRPDRLASYIQHQGAAHAGDIRSILADSESESHSDDQIVDAAVADLSEHRFGNAEELEQRRAILARIEALEAEVVRLNHSGGRGHNNPPELLPAEDIAAVTELEQEASSLKGELAKVEPDVARVGRSAKWFRQFVNTWRRSQSEAVKFWGKVADKARDRAAELVIATVIGGAAALGHVVNLVEGLVQAIIKWLGLI